MKDSNKEKSKLILPKKPKKLQYENLKKDEFETTKQYKERIKISNDAVDQKNLRRMKDWQKSVYILKQKYKKQLDNLKNNKNSNYLNFLQQAMHIKYGSPKIKSVKYNADKEEFEVNIKSTLGSYNKIVKVPVKLKYAKKFKKLLINKNFKPTIILDIVNGKLVFASIKEIQNPEMLVEKNEYNKAYLVKDKQKSVPALQSFIKKYPNSSFVSSAKTRVISLNEQIKIEEEKAKVAAEKRRKEDIEYQKRRDKEKQRKIDSYYAKKSIGDKVCMDGTAAFILSITITAYVENVNGNNIQIRIADTDGTTPNVNGVRLYRNTLIWDNYTNWYKCNY